MNHKLSNLINSPVKVVVAGIATYNLIFAALAFPIGAEEATKSSRAELLPQLDRAAAAGLNKISDSSRFTPSETLNDMVAASAELIDSPGIITGTTIGVLTHQQPQKKFAAVHL